MMDECYGMKLKNPGVCVAVATVSALLLWNPVEAAATPGAEGDGAAVVLEDDRYRAANFVVG